MSDFLRRWNELYRAANGILAVGTPGVRHPDDPCDLFEPGEPSLYDCNGDGHYMCLECAHLCVCRECGAREGDDECACDGG